MRSPALAFSLFAAVATVTAQSSIAHDMPLSPEGQAHVGSYTVHLPREYPAVGPPLLQERDGEGRHGASRAGRPEPVAHPSTAGHGAGAGDTNGGTSQSSPAVGGNAADGGNSTTTPDGGAPMGPDIFGIGSGVQSTVSGMHLLSSCLLHILTWRAGAQNGVSDDQASAAPAGFSYKPTPEAAYSYQRMRRVARGNADRRDDPLEPAEEGASYFTNQDNPDSDNSNNDGADGTSQRGTEVDGEGPNGGHAHSGQVGSSEGGKVYNSPASSD
ncbi:hypothetical protein C2E23DRAFT_724253 [Lenzites betulinus]|nr:hypothetical protein C2E23DRAFT_724253 [Lenzites betulinus]